MDVLGNNWRGFFKFCSEYKLELDRVKPFHLGLFLKRHLGGVATQRQHLSAVRLLFDPPRWLFFPEIVSSDHLEWRAITLRNTPAVDAHIHPSVHRVLARGNVDDSTAANPC
jgi:hypothetical protein